MKKKASCIVILNDKREIVLQKRSNNPNIFFSGYWGMFGGAALENESAEECIKREFYEETGYNIKEIKYLFQIEEHCIESVYLGFIKSETILKCYEGERKEAFTFSELSQLNISEYHRKIIENVKKNYLYMNDSI